METLYNIGDEIRITLDGKIIEYSVSKSGDCYTIELSDPKQRGNRVYLTSEDLGGNSFRKKHQDKINVSDMYDMYDPLGMG